MNRKELLHSFNLHDQSAIDDKIEPISAVNFNSLINNWQWQLAFIRHIGTRQFVTKASFVGGFEKTRT